MNNKKRGPKVGHVWSQETLTARSKLCTVDGKTIYPSVQSLIAALGNGRNGYKHPDFRYLEK